MNQPQAAVDAMNKATLRGQALSRRNALGETERAGASATIAERAADIMVSLLPNSVALYRPIGSECDTRVLIVKAGLIGADVGLPAIVDRSRIVFRRYRPGDPLVAGGFGTSVPSAEAPLIEPDVMIVPIVGFDRSGIRLGYGRGYYDGAIGALRAAGRDPRLIGIAFSAQEVEAIPAEPHDVRLDWIVTEKETLDFRGGKG
jgi:5-formyltetrahydrofolate cyclo-ligase